MAKFKAWVLLIFIVCAGGAGLLFSRGFQAGETGHSIVIVMPFKPDQLDPCEAPRSMIGPIIKQNVVETLVEFDQATATVIPRLATSWEQVTPTEWVFHLRKNVLFHDGADFDAEAVVYTLNRILDPTLTCITRTKYFDGNVIRAEALDSETVRFVTGEPVPILPVLLAQMVISSPNTPKGTYFQLPIGTGPYEFESWEYDSSVRLRRSNAYWGPQPVIKKATYIWRPSPVAAAMVKAGEADLAFSIAPQDADDPALDKVYPNSETSLFRLSTDVPPLEDVRVRMAINLAIDRQAMLGTIVSDKARIATQRIGPNVLGWNPTLVPHDFDPTGARRLLMAARQDGHPVDRPLRLIGRPGIFPNSEELVTAVASMLRAVGLTIEQQSLETSLWLDEANKPYPKDRPPTILLSMHDNNAGDAAFTLFFKYHSNGRQSDLHDPTLDALIMKAGTLQGEARAAAYGEAVRMIYQDIVADVPLFHMVNYMRISPRIDFTPSIANAVELQLAKIKLN